MFRLKTAGLPLALLSILVLTILPSCSPQNLVLEQGELEMEIGDSIVLTVKDMNPEELEWSSGDTSVAEVNHLGKVKAVGPGQAVITVKAGEKTATSNVVVRLEIRLTSDCLWLGLGETAQIQANTKAVIWRSEDTDIADIDQSGNVTAVAPGATRVIASFAGKEAASEVIVYGLTSESLILEVGGNQQVLFSPIPDGESVIWISEDSDIAEVDQDGNITAMALGKTRVIARVAGTEAVCEVTVQLPKIAEAGVIMGDAEVPPTISPDGNFFVCYESGMFISTVTLMDLDGNKVYLPGRGAGRASWRGTKFVWHNLEFLRQDDNYDLIVSEDVIYVYDTQDHTYIKINVSLPAPIRLEPVMTSDSTITAISPKGLWEYNLNQESWTQVVNLQIEVKGHYDWSETLIWSPDFSKVAWVEEGENDDRLVLLDIESGSKETIYQHRSKILTKWPSTIYFAWSHDSTNLAVTAVGDGSILILTLDGNVVESLPAPDIIPITLRWVPGQDLVSYNTGSDLVMENVLDGSHRQIPNISTYYSWLQNGNITHVIYDDNRGYIMELFKVDWTEIN